MAASGRTAPTPIMEPNPLDPSPDNIADIFELIEKHRLLEVVARNQETPRSALLEQLQHRQNLVELRKRLRTRHPADIAHLLELLPVADRLVVWRELPVPLAAQSLVQVSDGIRAALVSDTPRAALVDMLRELDADDLRYLSPWVPSDVIDAVVASLEATDRKWVEDEEGNRADTVGRLMTRELVSVKDGNTVAECLLTLRQCASLPEHLDRIFVVDARNVLVGAIELGPLVIAAPEEAVSSVMQRHPRAFVPSDDAHDVAQAFERYDLLSAPVVDERGKLIGRVTADVVVDFIRASADQDVLALAGLRKAENLFGPVLDSARNRWPWLAVNLATAFVASRVIGAFEAEIEQLVALAALMPIVASIGGNTGNQTVALVIRGLALDQLRAGNRWHLLRKELTVSLLNGALWGAVVGLFATLVYHSAALGAVMSGAVFMNLVVAACVGVLVPLGLHALDRDPAQGASVILTFATDSMGFFLFLALASAFLM